MKQSALFPSRALIWFSCGAASACAAKLACEQYPDAIVCYCDTSKDEHSDNLRFRIDVERWLGRSITLLRHPLYSTVEQVCDAFHYMSGPKGARCTKELKREPRKSFQHFGDVHIFGFTADEQSRIEDFEENNPDLQLQWPLRDRGLCKDDCFLMLRRAGITLPVMYGEGFRNNNCRGCIKSSSPAYWNLTRKHFPEVFQCRAAQSRRLGVRLVKWKGERIFLDELPRKAVCEEPENISCGPECRFYEPMTTTEGETR